MKKLEKQLKQIEIKSPNEYHFDSMGRQSIPSQNHLVRKEKEDSLTYFRLPYRKEMQTSRSDRFTSERKTTKMESQSGEINGLDSKHLIRQAIIEPSKDRYDDQGSERCDCNEGPNNLKLTGYFHGQANLDTSKVTGYYYNTHAKVTLKNPLSTQVLDDQKSLLNQRI